MEVLNSIFINYLGKSTQVGQLIHQQLVKACWIH